MAKIDIQNIKRKTNEMIGYSMYERENMMKQKRMKNVICVVAIFTFFIAGTMTVNALTDNAIVNKIKEVLTFKVDEEGTNVDCKYLEDGTRVCYYHVDEK